MINIIKFKKSNRQWIHAVQHYNELANKDYLGVFYKQGPQLVDGTGQHSSLSPFFGWYLFPNRKYNLQGDGEYLQTRLPLTSQGELEFCVELLNNAHQNDTATLATFISEINANGSTVATDVFVDGVGEIVLLNKAHPYSCRISPRLSDQLRIYGDTSFGWCYPEDTEDFLLEFLHI